MIEQPTREQVEEVLRARPLDQPGRPLVWTLYEDGRLVVGFGQDGQIVLDWGELVPSLLCFGFWRPKVECIGRRECPLPVPCTE